MLTILAGILLITAVVVWASFFEWALHRYAMHRPLGKFTYAYQAHALVHHGLFKADRTYHLSAHENQADSKTIPMAWWNWMVLVPLAASPFILAGFFGGKSVTFVALAVIAGYYGLYEYFHWCMHLPKGRRLERLGVFRALNGHHLLHHRYPNRNLNVVLPLADFCCGTLMPRAPQPFKQPVHPSVPDVQPSILQAIIAKVVK